MKSIEDVAKREHRRLLVLDTVEDGEGEPLYTKLGWQRVGRIPDYALKPIVVDAARKSTAGSPYHEADATVVYYKQLAG